MDHQNRIDRIGVKCQLLTDNFIESFILNECSVHVGPPVRPGLRWSGALGAGAARLGQRLSLALRRFRALAKRRPTGRVCGAAGGAGRPLAPTALPGRRRVGPHQGRRQHRGHAPFRAHQRPPAAPSPRGEGIDGLP